MTLLIIHSEIVVNDIPIHCHKWKMSNLMNIIKNKKKNKGKLHFIQKNTGKITLNSKIAF